MTRNSLLSFSETARTARDELFGEAAIWNGSTIIVTVQAASSLLLSDGGFEKRGTLRALSNSRHEFKLQDRISLRSNVYKITEIRCNDGFSDVGLTLEPLQVNG